jgi:hypothetical protein|nr:hypothetical protein [Kofleriaceae bacterium]
MRTYAIVAIALIGASCQRHDDSGTSVAGGSATAAGELAIKTQSGLAMKNTGVEPRRELRYHVAKGVARSLQLAIDIDMDIPGQFSGPLPTMRMIGDLAFGDAKPDGSVPMTMTVHDIHLADRPGSPPQAALIQKRLGVLEGFVLHGDLSPLGAMANVTTDTKNVPPDLRAQLDAMTQNLQQIALPLPAEAVGVGATWDLSKSTEQGSMKLTTVTHFTVTKLDGDVVGFHTAVEVSAPKQTLDGSTQVELDSVTGGGSGDGTVDLGTFSITGASTNGFRAEVSAMGQHTSMGTKMSMTMSPVE